MTAVTDSIFVILWLLNILAMFENTQESSNKSSHDLNGNKFIENNKKSLRAWLNNLFSFLPFSELTSMMWKKVFSLLKMWIIPEIKLFFGASVDKLSFGVSRLNNLVKEKVAMKQQKDFFFGRNAEKRNAEKKDFVKKVDWYFFRCQKSVQKEICLTGLIDAFVIEV